MQISITPRFIEPPRETVAVMRACSLRTFRRDDLHAVQCLLSSAALWRTYAPGVESPAQDAHLAQRYLAHLHSRPRTSAFAVACIDTDEVVGCLHGEQGEGVMSRNMEMACWVGSAVQRSGMASDAARAFVKWAFEQRGMLRVWSKTYHPNLAAIGALRAAGFTLEARLPRAGFHNGMAIDELIYARHSTESLAHVRASSRQWLADLRSPESAVSEPALSQPANELTKPAGFFIRDTPCNAS